MTAEFFKQKYMPHHKKMYRVAFRLLEDAQDAEDAVQEIFIKLWNKRDELNHIENTESYCIVMLRNLCLDFLRSKKKHKMQSTEDVTISDDFILSSEIEINDEIKHIESIIKQLPEQQQKVIKLKHFDECSTEEIEEIMGLTAINVRVLLSRARKKVRELFEKQYTYGN